MTLMTFLVIFLITLEIFLITLMIFLIILNNIPNRMGALPCQQVLSVYSSVVSPASPSLPPPSIYIPCNCDLLAATQDTPYKLLWAGDKYLGWSSHLPHPQLAMYCGVRRIFSAWQFKYSSSTRTWRTSSKLQLIAVQQIMLCQN